MQMRIVAGATVAVVFVLVLGEEFTCFSHQQEKSLIVYFVSHTVIVVTVLFFRSKNQDDLDKKTNNHLPLPLDYASNEGERTNSCHVLVDCLIDMRDVCVELSTFR